MGMFNAVRTAPKALIETGTQIGDSLKIIMICTAITAIATLILAAITLGKA